jgi:asparagine synthase (glutamine-hydrolysing)
MCGIAGFFGKFDRQLLDEFNRALSHRGPDGEGTFFEPDAGIGLAHRRLAIIDLSSAGAQPMWDNSLTCCIVFNGEIYNYRELRAELAGTGYHFRTKTDTEVILGMYKTHGIGMLNRLNGIFAFALWDAVEKVLFLARDHFGVKPLYFSECPGRGMVFGSEIKALLKAHVAKEVNPLALAATLTYLWTPGDATIFKSVRKVRPGHYLKIKNAQVVEDRLYYSLTVSSQGSGSHPASSGPFDLQNALRRAVRRQMVSDVPVGAMFSGGLDSSAVVAFAREYAPDTRFRCFTIGFRGQEAAAEGLADDLIYAKRIAKHLDVDLEEITVGTESVELLQKVLFHMDEPCPDPSPINVLLISQLARQQGIPVLLSGVAGDDLFGGYRRHLALKFEGVWSWMPATGRRQLSRWGRRLPQSSNVSRRISRALALAELDGDERFASYFMWASPHAILPVLDKAILEQFNPQDLTDMLLSDVDAASPASRPLDRMLRTEMMHFLADHNLNYVDKLSMAAGIEVRVPFLDRDVVELAAGMPETSKVKGIEGKWVLKKALEDYLPSDTIYRPKTGFGAPLRHWIRNELRWLIDELVSDRSFRERGWFDVEAFKRVVALDREGKIDGAYSIYAVLCIELWCREYL